MRGVTAVLEQLRHDMGLDLDAGGVLPENRQRRAVAVGVGEHGADQGDLALEPSSRRRADQFGRIDAERPGGVIGPAVPGNLERSWRHLGPQQLRDLGRKAQLVRAEARLVPADRIIEPFLDQIGIAVLEAGDISAEIAALRLRQRRGGMGGDHDDRDVRLQYLVAQRPVGIGPGRHVEQYVEPDGARARGFELCDQPAQERTVDRRAADQPRQRQLGYTDDDNGIVLRLFDWQSALEECRRRSGWQSRRARRTAGLAQVR